MFPFPLSKNFEHLDNYDDGRAISISELRRPFSHLFTFRLKVFMPDTADLFMNMNGDTIQ